LRAQNLTVSLPPLPDCKVCDGIHCRKYCISHMTWEPTPDQSLMMENLPTAKYIAQMAGTNNILYTAKMEPTQNWDLLISLTKYFSPVTSEVQTNGIMLSKNPEKLRELRVAGMHTIAVSVDNIEQIVAFADFFAAIEEARMNLRICLNITNLIPVEMGFKEIFEVISNLPRSQSLGRQLLIRNIMFPEGAKDCKEKIWIKENCSKERYIRLHDEFIEMIGSSKKPDDLLAFGLVAHSYDDHSVVFSDYCIEEKSKISDFRSIIFHQNGHGYKRWDDKTSFIW
jgi:hypothetical protein